MDYIYPEKKLSEEEKSQLRPSGRMEICTQCEKFDKTFRRCTVCGCFMDIKTKFRGMHCPLKVW